MENKKQLKARLTNDISKRYSSRIAELEESRNALRIKLEIERKQFRELQTKYLDLAQEIEKLRDWNDRLMEFFDLDADLQKKFVQNLKRQNDLDSTIDRFLKFTQIFNIG